MLNFDRYDGPDTTPLLIAHGLFGSGRNWRAIARHMARRHPVIAVDMRNHGGSPRADVMDYPSMADDLAAVITSLGRPALVLGHSMGGKAAMMLALSHPDLVRALMVGDIAPIAYDHAAENQAHIAVMAGLDLTQISRRSEADAALAHQLPDPALRAFFLQSLDFTGPKPRWMLNLPVLDAAMPVITGFPETDRHFPGPTVFLSGARSAYMSEPGRARAAVHFPAARFARLKDAGHWLHADQPRAFMTALQSFCAATGTA